MTATIEERKTTNQESWADLLAEMSIPVPPKDELITRSALFDRLAETPAKAFSPAALIDWEKRGFLPRAVVQSHDGMVQATYPAWWPDLVALAWWLTRQGYSREEARRAVIHWLDESGRKQSFSPIDAHLEAVHMAVRNLAHGYRRQQMTRFDQIAKARLIFVDAEGEPVYEGEFDVDDIDQDNIPIG
jgi:hypothetical protein